MTMKTTKVTIDKVSIKHIVDKYPDISWIGEYTDDIDKGIIVRDLGQFYEKLPAEMERDVDGRFYKKGEPELPSRGREYRGFKPYAGGEKIGTKNYYKYGMQDWKRMEALERGNFCFIGIMAEAEVSYPIDGTNSRRIEYFTSGGLWGIESDSDAKYIEEIEQEQIDELKTHLKQFGIKWDNNIEIQEAE
jgi:hypothetical protein